MLGYIYKITNKINGKSYVGWSENPQRRFLNHRKADGSSPLLHKAIKKYGIDAFTFEILCEDTLSNEDYYIQHYQTMLPAGYNMQQGGFAPPLGKYRTETMKEASRKGTRLALKGKTYEEIHGIVEANRLKEIRRLSGSKNKGKKKIFSDQHKINLSKAAKEKPSRGMSGKSHRVETKEKQRQWHEKKVRVVSKNNERLWVSSDDWRCSHPDWQRGLKWKDK